MVTRIINTDEIDTVADTDNNEWTESDSIPKKKTKGTSWKKW